MPWRASHDGGFGERAIEAALRSELDLQSGGGFEDAALALDLGQVGFATAIGHVLAEHDDARIALHFLVQRQIDFVHHGARVAGEMRLGFELRGSRIDFVRVQITSAEPLAGGSALRT